jgi:putative transposase
MIERDNKKLSIRRQCALLAVNRNRLEPRAAKRTASDLELMRLIDGLHTEFPFLGARKIVRELRDLGHRAGRGRVGRLMRLMGIEALVPQPYTSKASPENPIYPYLLRGRAITRADEVWCADITYIPMEKGHAYLVAIMDWHTRAVLAWEVSNTMDTAFCLRTLRRAMAVAGRVPDIFNTDQGSQFTSREWVDELEKHGVKVSMDGRGRWMDNVFIERLWRSLKYERLRLWSYGDLPDLERHIGWWMDYYNHRRKHQHLDYATPWSLYRSSAEGRAAAA